MTQLSYLGTDWDSGGSYGGYWEHKFQIEGLGIPISSTVRDDATYTYYPTTYVSDYTGQRVRVNPGNPDAFLGVGFGPRSGGLYDPADVWYRACQFANEASDNCDPEELWEDMNFLEGEFSDGPDPRADTLMDDDFESVKDEAKRKIEISSDIDYDTSRELDALAAEAGLLGLGVAGVLAPEPYSSLAGGASIGASGVSLLESLFTGDEVPSDISVDTELEDITADLEDRDGDYVYPVDADYLTVVDDGVSDVPDTNTKTKGHHIYFNVGLYPGEASGLVVESGFETSNSADPNCDVEIATNIPALPEPDSEYDAEDAAQDMVQFMDEYTNTSVEDNTNNARDVIGNTVFETY
jgi:hypothetical protein